MRIRARNVLPWTVSVAVIFFFRVDCLWGDQWLFILGFGAWRRFTKRVSFRSLAVPSPQPRKNELFGPEMLSSPSSFLPSLLHRLRVTQT